MCDAAELKKYSKIFLGKELPFSDNCCQSCLEDGDEETFYINDEPIKLCCLHSRELEEQEVLINWEYDFNYYMRKGDLDDA